MYEAMNCPIPGVAGYLARLGLDRAPKADLDGLNALVWRHQTHIPFEDLNTSCLGLPVSLDIPALYDKIIVRRRGGYCYELNGLFTRLLLDLGFDARSVFCRVVRGRDFLPPCAHRAVVVALADGLYFCDVGFGGPMPGGALRLEDGYCASIHGEIYRVDRFDAYWWTLSRVTSKGDTEALIQFNTFPQLPQEFLAVNRMAAENPDSIFVRQVMVNLRTETGVKSIAGETLTLRDAGGVRTVRLDSAPALREALRTHFGICGLEPWSE